MKKLPGHRICALAALAVLVFSLFSCQTVIEPFTGRKQYLMTSLQEEATLGLQAWNDMLKTEKTSSDMGKKAAVERVGRNISQVAEKPDFQWEFKVFENDVANAFCLPGGKVGVNSGLFKFTANDAELAVVVGHEVGHAIARHGGERMTQGMMQNLVGLGLTVALGSRAEEEKVRWLAAYTGITTVGVLLPFSREHEYAADQIGMMLMAKAGYDPAAAVTFWTKFGADDKTPGIMQYLSTHPLSSKRIEKMRALLPKAQAEYAKAPKKLGLGQTYH